MLVLRDVLEGEKEPLAPLAAAEPLAPGGQAPELEVERVEESLHGQAGDEPSTPSRVGMVIEF